MPHINPPDSVLRDLLLLARRIAVVGLSSDPDRPSHGVARRMQAVGYEIVPVNPNERVVLGRPAYATLDDVEGPVDIVDVFRRPEHTPPIAEAAVRIGAKALWLQSGIVNDEAARIASGLIVVMDECIAVAHSRLRIPPKVRLKE
jgi:predicted CoA-binding protein